MGPVITKTFHINNASGPVVQCLARRGQSSVGNTATKASVDHLLSSVLTLTLYFFVLSVPN